MTSFQLKQHGLSGYLQSGWNWVDLAMDTLFISAYFIWFFMFVYSLDDQPLKDLLLHLADGCFCLAVVFSFFRAIYLCQITSYLGLVQLCLGEMVTVSFFRAIYLCQITSYLGLVQLCLGEMVTVCNYGL